MAERHGRETLKEGPGVSSKPHPLQQSHTHTHILSSRYYFTSIINNYFLQQLEGLRCHADGLDNELTELKLRLVEVEYERSEEVERCRGEAERATREAREAVEEGERERRRMEGEVARLQLAAEEVGGCPGQRCGARTLLVDERRMWQCGLGY